MAPKDSDPTTLAERSIDNQILEVYRAHGWSSEDLVDPGDLTPDALREGGWKAAHYNESCGVLTFPISAEALTDESHYGDYAVDLSEGGYLRSGVQPIGFVESEDADPVLSGLERKRGTNFSCTVFVIPGAEPTLEVESKREAVELLAHLQYDGELLRPVAEAYADVFGADLSTAHFSEWGKEETISPTFLMPRLANTTEMGAREADSTISGKKKIARQKLNRNLDVLEESVGLTA